jgi:spermidine/putrescine transport system ATP-binding protein
MGAKFFYEARTLEDLVLHQLQKSFGHIPILKGIDLTIRQGEFFSLLGPSGCGKTTILRILAGFEQPTSGYITFDGQRLTDLAPHRRPVNTVFQNYALFPHMNVFDNVSFGLRIRKVPSVEAQKRVEEALELVNLPGYGARKVPSLSGGEKQRVALARALVNKPKILLLDEPLAALDLQLRRKVQFEIKEIHRKIGTTFIYVTHDQEEALAMSDRIGVMLSGQIDQVGTPQEIYDQPHSRFVAHFIGSSNVLEGTVKARIDMANMVDVDVAGLGMMRAYVRNGTGPGDSVGVMIRPEKIQIVHDTPRAQGYTATIEETLYLGALIQYKLQLADNRKITAVQHATAQKNPIRVGNRVRIRWATEDLVVIER